jgi:hypothetical protein
LQVNIPHVDGLQASWLGFFCSTQIEIMGEAGEAPPDIPVPAGIWK